MYSYSLRSLIQVLVQLGVVLFQSLQMRNSFFHLLLGPGDFGEGVLVGQASILLVSKVPKLLGNGGTVGLPFLGRQLATGRQLPGRSKGKNQGEEE